jgi:hypothetical protein
MGESAKADEKPGNLSQERFHGEPPETILEGI